MARLERRRGGHWLILLAAAFGCGGGPQETDPDAPSTTDGSAGGSSTGSTTSASPATGAGPTTEEAGTDGESSTTGAVEESPRLATFRNGGFWTDVDGNRIEAHGGGFYFEDGTYYWIGEDKSHNSGNFRGVNCYASRDLEHWEFRRAIITRATAPALDASDRIIERPKVIFNDGTQKYVMWLHWEGANYAEAEAGVFSSDTIDGDYVYHSSFRPNGNMSRDDTLFKDDDGTAYFISAANENADLVIYELTDDYLDIERQVITLWRSSWREAPAMFKHEGRYWLVTSGATGWDPNQARYASAPTVDGPWTDLQNLGSNITYDTQPTYIIPFHGSETTTFIYAGDRWQDPDLGSSKYIWLPLELAENGLRLDFYDSWQLDLETGKWWPYDEFLPQQDWRVLYVDSEEIEGEDGAAANAFDGSASTYWHTGWDDLVHPHELQLDLGARYVLRTLRVLPRQDADDHGIIADYEFYVSDDSNAWGDPVASGRLGTGRAETRVEFGEKPGRYVRLVALSEIRGQGWTSLAELDLAGDPP